MSIIKQAKENPFGAIGLLLTLAGVAFSVVNFIILNRVEPLTSRVVAIEDRNQKADPLINDFYVIKEKVNRIEKTVDKIADRLGVIQ